MRSGKSQRRKQNSENRAQVRNVLPKVRCKTVKNNNYEKKRTTTISAVNLAPFLHKEVTAVKLVEVEEMPSIKVGGEWRRAVEYKEKLEATVKKLSFDLSEAQTVISEMSRANSRNLLQRFGFRVALLESSKENLFLTSKLEHCSNETTTLHLALKNQNAKMEQLEQRNKILLEKFQRLQTSEVSMSKNIEELQKQCVAADSQIQQFIKNRNEQKSKNEQLLKQLNAESQKVGIFRKAKEGKDTQILLLLKEKERINKKLEKFEKGTHCNRRSRSRWANINNDHPHINQVSSNTLQNTVPETISLSINGLASFNPWLQSPFSPNVSSNKQNCKISTCASNFKNFVTVNTQVSQELKHHQRFPSVECEKDLKDGNNKSISSKELENFEIDNRNRYWSSQVNNYSQKNAAVIIKKLGIEKEELLNRFRAATRRAQKAEARCNKISGISQSKNKYKNIDTKSNKIMPHIERWK